MKTNFLLLIFYFLLIEGFSQSIYFKFKDGKKTEFTLNSIKSITYSGNNINVNKINDSVLTYDVNIIEQLNYNGFPNAIIDYLAIDKSMIVYPNPSNGPIEIAYKLNSAEHTSIEIIDFQGRVIKNIINRELSPGDYKSNWDLTDNQGHIVASGNYICRLYQGKKITTKNIIIQK